MYVEKEVIFLKADVAKYQRLMGSGKKTEIMPPMMPALAYQQLEIPWKYDPPVILRTQVTNMLAPLQAERAYIAKLEIEDIKNYGSETLIKERLTLQSAEGVKHFDSISKLIIGGIR